MPEPLLPGGVPSVPQFRPVSADVFSKRAKRLKDLARGHSMEDYLRFVSALARAQSALLESLTVVAVVPDAVQLRQSREHGLPPLSIDNLRPLEWRHGLQGLIDALHGDELPARTRHVMEGLRSSDQNTLDRDAASVLTGAYTEVEPGRMPFIGAALQIYWTKMALELGNGGQSPGVDFRQCPVCGSPPVAGIIRTGGAERGLRYLACSLCASEWHLVRVKCSSCAATKNISYLYVDGANDAIRAECCDDCKRYLKVLYLEKDPAMEPIADDLASLALDLLVDEQGYRRLAPNLLFAPGIEV